MAIGRNPNGRNTAVPRGWLGTRKLQAWRIPETFLFQLLPSLCDVPHEYLVQRTGFRKNTGLLGVHVCPWVQWWCRAPFSKYLRMAQRSFHVHWMAMKVHRALGWGPERQPNRWKSFYFQFNLLNWEERDQKKNFISTCIDLILLFIYLFF